MSKITLLSELRRAKEVCGIPSYDTTLNILLQKTEKLRKQFVVDERLDLVILEKAQLKEFFFAGIFSECRKRGWIAPPFYHCAGYVADVCAHAVSNTPQYWTAFEYLLEALAEGNRRRRAEFLQKGGDTCFLISVIFQGHAQRRGLRVDFYRGMGSHLYARWYAESKREIGSHMSNYFSQIAMATTECIHTMQNA